MPCTSTAASPFRLSDVEPVSTASTTVALARNALAARPRIARWIKPELKLFHFPDQSSISPSQADDIDAFLASEPIAALTRIMTIILLTEAGALRDGESLDVLRPAFDSMAKRWNVDRPDNWSKIMPSVWDHLDATLRDHLPRTEALLEKDDESSLFSQFVAGPLATSAKEYSRFNRTLLDLAGNLDNLTRASILAREVAASARAGRHNLFTHLDLETEAIDRAKLYIERDVSIGPDRQTSISSRQLFERHAFRVVLLGNPGAGKSTLVEHLARTEPSLDHGSVCTIVIRCRDYAGQFSDHSVSAAISRLLQRDYGLTDASPEIVESMLILGKATVIFDGLDEVINANQRLDLVKRIERLVIHQPLCSVLVTSREIGYQQAPLDASLFEHGSLSEFSDAQLERYVDRWFTQTGSPELIQAFLHEAQTVSDIAHNPLMLSLLCSLYRAYGAIPSNRFAVYERCADLLFNRWDSHRQIMKGEDVPDYGTRVMEQIASLFYKHQSAQSGVDEQQLLRMISIYLRDTFGVTNPEERARRFLNFCAGRAWLLVKLGTRTSTGTPLYGFTHRTFYEYFSAKAIARSEEQSRDVASNIVAIFDKDASSVLPELLIQAKEEVTERGAAKVFEAVCDMDGRSDLILRLMNTALPATSRRRGFQLICDRWSAPYVTLTLSTFESLLALHFDPREQFVEEFLMSSAYSWLPPKFLEAWAAYGLLSRSQLASRQWVSRISSLLEDQISAFRQNALANVDTEHRANATLNWLIATGKMTPDNWPTSSLLIVEVFHTQTAGAAFFALRDSLGGPAVREEIASKLVLDWTKGKVVAKSKAKYSGQRLGRGVILDARSRSWSPTVVRAATGLAMMFAEAGASLAWLNRALLGLDIDVEALAAYREYRKGRAQRPNDDLGQSAAKSWPKLASWAKDWSRGTHSLLMRDSAQWGVP
jgi:energy-coupling factor transporter ATP-binding protein EcfA2